MTLPFQSLRWRIQAWHALLLLIVIVSALVPSYHFAKESLLQRLDREIERMERNLIHSLMKSLEAKLGGVRGPIPFEEFTEHLRSGTLTPPFDIDETFAKTGPGSAYFSIRDLDDKLLLQSEHAPDGLVFLPLRNAEVNETFRDVEGRRELAKTFYLGFKIVLGRDITPELDQLRTMAGIHIGIGLAVWLAGLLGGWWLAGRAIRPIETISATAITIADGDLSERIDSRAMDSELAELSRVLNGTFDRLESTLRRQRQFTADAAHELRTPITVILTETQRLLKRSFSTEEYREGLQTCRDVGDRMRNLAESLLVLAQHENASIPHREGEGDLSSILCNVVDHISPIAEAKQRRIAIDLSAAQYRGDPDSLFILFATLIKNAIEHGGNAIVRCRSDGMETVVHVLDDGPGIADADLPCIFDRFYRADSARTGGSGHCGLGLAIAKSIAESHGGSISASNRLEGGAVFEVRLPKSTERTIQSKTTETVSMS